MPPSKKSAARPKAAKASLGSSVSRSVAKAATAKTVASKPAAARAAKAVKDATTPRAPGVVRGGVKSVRKKASLRSKLRPRAAESAEATPTIGPGFSRFADMDEAMRFLYSRTNVEAISPNKIEPHVWKLDRMHALMEALDHPERAFKSVHVAGSKGKGSVCEMTAAALSGCGLATGLYTSPHVTDIRERIRLNGEWISPRDFVSVVSEVALAGESLKRKWGPATFFELMTAAAFLRFAHEAVDMAVIEVGLGGRLDSTNVITPEVAAVTAIQLEHTQILGDTVEKIAREKAGIFKPGVPALTIAQSKPAIVEVFRDVAASVGCPLEVLGEQIPFTHHYDASYSHGNRVRVSVSTPRIEFEHVPVPLPGEHQAANCGLALAIVGKLRERGLAVTERQVAAGLAQTQHPGRFEMVYQRPRILVDGAHNPESVQALMKSLGAHLRYDSLIVIFGCANDKDAGGMLRRLAAGADKVIFTQASGNSRATDPRDLQRRFADLSSKMSQLAPTVKEAINLAAKAAGRDDLIVVTGSFYLAGEAKRLMLEKKAAAPAVQVPGVGATTRT